MSSESYPFPSLWCSHAKKAHALSSLRGQIRRRSENISAYEEKIFLFICFPLHSRSPLTYTISVAGASRRKRKRQGGPKKKREDLASTIASISILPASPLPYSSLSLPSFVHFPFTLCSTAALPSSVALGYWGLSAIIKNRHLLQKHSENCCQHSTVHNSPDLNRIGFWVPLISMSERCAHISPIDNMGAWFRWAHAHMLK